MSELSAIEFIDLFRAFSFHDKRITLSACEGDGLLSETGLPHVNVSLRVQLFPSVDDDEIVPDFTSTIVPAYEPELRVQQFWEASAPAKITSTMSIYPPYEQDCVLETVHRVWSQAFEHEFREQLRYMDQWAFDPHGQRPSLNLDKRGTPE